MSWWDTQADVTIGDQPADILGRALDAAAAGAAGKPTLARLTASFAAALGAEPGLLDDGPPACIAVSREGVAPVVVGATSGEVDAALRDQLLPALRDIRAAYEASQERRPRARELLAVFEFVLGGGAAPYVVDGQPEVTGVAPSAC